MGTRIPVDALLPTLRLDANRQLMAIALPVAHRRQEVVSRAAAGTRWTAVPAMAASSFPCAARGR